QVGRAGKTSTHVPIDGRLNLRGKVEYGAVACQVDFVACQSLFPIRAARGKGDLCQEVEGVKDTGVVLRIVESLSAGIESLSRNGFYIRSGTQCATTHPRDAANQVLPLLRLRKLP